MAITINKYTSHVHWDNEGVGVSIRGYSSAKTGVGTTDLSNYYTKTDLNTAHSSSVHWTNINWAGGLSDTHIYGTSLVTGRLVSQGHFRALTAGTSIVAGHLRDSQKLGSGISNGTSTAIGALLSKYDPGYVFIHSVTSDVNKNISLVGDVAAPGNSYFYGTDGAGTRGWYLSQFGSWELNSDSQLTPIGGATVDVLIGDILISDYVIQGGSSSSYFSIRGNPEGGSIEATTIYITGGTGDLLPGGNVSISGGNYGGHVYITGGEGDPNSSTGAAGDVFIRGGQFDSSLDAGNIYFGTGTVGTLRAKSTETNVVYYNTSTGLLTYGTAGTGSGGYTFADSLFEDTGNVVSLDGDVGSPAAYTYYGTDGLGAKGFHLFDGIFDFSQGSIGVYSGMSIELEGDNVSPGNNFYYGTDGTGDKGWHAHQLYTFDTDYSVIEFGGLIVLNGDTPTPGNTKYYGTNATGQRGFFDLTSIYTFSNSLQLVGSTVSLDNDSNTPGGRYFYGTNISEIKGWWPLITGVSTSGVVISTGSTFVVEPPMAGFLHYDSGYEYVDGQLVSSIGSYLLETTLQYGELIVDPWSASGGTVAGRLYYGTTEPSYTTVLNYNGVFRTTQIYTNDIIGFAGDDNHVHIIGGAGVGIGDAGSVVLRAGTGSGDPASSHGDIYISPIGGYIYLGDSIYTGSSVNFSCIGTLAAISLSLTQKGTGSLYLGKPEGASTLYGSSITLNTNELIVGSSSTVASRMIYGRTATEAAGQHLTIKAANAHTALGANFAGGNLYLGGGVGVGTGAKGSIYLHNGSTGVLNAKTSETNVVFYNTTTGLISYGTPTGSTLGFQSITFANPLNIDCTTYKDWRCGAITGNTTLNLNNTVDGDSGMFEFVIDGTQRTVWLGTMWNRGAGTFDVTPYGDNIISWRNVQGQIVYVVNPVG